MTDGTKASQTWVVEVTVLPKAGVNDPQGEAILGGLASLGYHGVRGVRSGRFIRLSVEASNADEAKRAVTAMCDQLLANPVIESYQVVVSEGA